MKDIPRSALVLGLAGLLPFLWGAATVLLPDLGMRAMGRIGGRFIGPYVQIAYGTVILAFMAGVLWGFATRAAGRLAALGYTLSVVPALWAFFMVGGGAVSAAVNLATGFAGLLLLDWFFWNAGLAPRWWMALRVPLTLVVLLCLAPVIL
ncbi:DUF3429 domain-containing protein [Salibaculum halophilum]|uniref:DUF3429 domain-containing protein n=1 Tax=Salibaculum halophilum TaxID=1914408 RepID=UPI000A0FBBA9|nr:DUF3429 domain-containing protein [Salibaculum halophilum]